jgi:small-conductance mechanosensitive channel
VVLSAVLGIVLWALAALLVLAPWGIESDDLLGSLRSAFFGFRLGEVTISPSGIVLAMALFAMGLWATRSIQRWLDQRFLPLTSLDSGMRNSIRTSLGYAGYILALGVALAQIGLDIQKLAIVAGALSVGIGFGLQSIVNNFVSGLIILWERTIRVGDWIVVGDEQGYVRKINIRATEIETFDRAIMVVPNSTLVGGNVKNWVRGNKIGRIKIPLTLPLDSDPALVRATLLACAQEQELVLHEPAPQVILTGFAPGELKFELIVFVRDVESSLRARSEINFLILERFRAASIAMAPPPAVPTAVVNFHGLDKLEQVLTQAQVPAVSMPAPASIA